MIETIKKYKTVIITVIGAIAAIVAIVNSTVQDIDKEIVKIDSVVNTLIDTTKDSL